jgi:hypothetical protein
MDRRDNIRPPHAEFLGGLTGLEATTLEQASHAPVKNKNVSALECLAKIAHFNTSRSSKIHTPVNEVPY